MKLNKPILLVSALLCLSSNTGWAHVRNFLDTYGYPTMERGHSEMELHTDYQRPHEGRNYWLHQTEVEYGITDHYTLGLYGVFRDGVGFSAAKAENRVRMSEPGEWPIDTALYLELKKSNGNKDSDELESKIILSKDIGRWNFTTNGILSKEKETKPDGETEWDTEKGLLLATAYKTGTRVTPGLEILFQNDQSRITPGLYVDLMPEVRLNLGAGLGLAEKADNLQIKTILEIEF